MVEGRFIVEVIGDVVLVVQEGYFSLRLERLFIDEMDRATHAAAAAGGGACFHVADVTRLEDVALVGRIRFEQWASRVAPIVRRSFVITNVVWMRRTMELSARLIPGARLRFAPSIPAALRLAARESLSDEVAAVLAAARWQRVTDTRTG